MFDVAATLYPRTPLTRAGLAPLTSMFLYGAGGAHAFDDFRPQVHDSDGLLNRRRRRNSRLSNRLMINLWQAWDGLSNGFFGRRLGEFRSRAGMLSSIRQTAEQIRPGDGNRRVSSQDGIRRWPRLQCMSTRRRGFRVGDGQAAG